MKTFIKAAVFTVSCVSCNQADFQELAVVNVFSEQVAGQPLQKIADSIYYYVSKDLIIEPAYVDDYPSVATDSGDTTEFSIQNDAGHRTRVHTGWMIYKDPSEKTFVFIKPDFTASLVKDSDHQRKLNLEFGTFQEDSMEVIKEDNKPVPGQFTLIYIAALRGLNRLTVQE